MHHRRHRVIQYTENAKHLYDFARAHPGFFKPAYIISIITWFIVGASYFYVFRDNGLFWIFFAPVVLYIVAYNVLSKVIMLHFKKFDLVYHNQLKSYWNNLKEYPSVDVFLPICGESHDTLRNTWEGVRQLVYNYPGAIIPHVLDDKGDEIAKKMAAEFEFNYFSRPNKGEMKKAGNLKYGFTHTKGEFILILDADFRPEPNMLEELMPYFLAQNTRDYGEEIGIVQSPQSFLMSEELAKSRPLAFGAASIQDYFYHFIQCARQDFGSGAICVGSNAVYRRAALETIGGTAQIEHSEDVWTGFKLISKGWRLKYVPLCIAFGECPDNAQAFYKQQSRWCSGSMSLMTSKEFWTAPLPWYTKLCFISGFAFYISNVMYLLLPFITIANIFTGNFGISLWYYVFIAAMSFNAIFLLSLHIYPRWKFSTIVAHMVAAWSYVFTLINLIFKRREPWQPTGAKMKLSPNFLLLRRSIILYCCLIAIGMGIAVYFAGPRLLEPINVGYFGWLVINLFNHSSALYGLYRYAPK